MKLLSMFESKKFSKDLQFYKHFGTLNVREYGTESPLANQEQEIKEIEVENKSDCQENNDNQCSQRSDNCYNFCQKQIPLDLNKQEYAIYSSIDNLLRVTMKKKNKLVLSHARIVDMCDEISNSVRLLIDYFLHTPLSQEQNNLHLSSIEPFFIEEKIMQMTCTDVNTCEKPKPAAPEFVFPEGEKKGLFISLMLDNLWKVIMLKIDDILLHQREIIKDEVREKSSLIIYDK